MGLQRDFIGRILEDFRDNLSRIEDLKRKRQWDLALEEISKCTLTLLGPELKLPDSLRASDFRITLHENGVGEEKLLILARLLRQKGEVQILHNHIDTGKDNLKMALMVLEWLNEQSLQQKKWDLSLQIQIREIGEWLKL
ncbi:MAG: hypothetical protein ACYCOO_02855 [Chitinophagaceae bacterium]